VLVEQRQVKVRLASMDAPERGQAFGRASRTELARICAGQAATVVDHGLERNGRTLGTVYCQGIDANANQVRAGMAWVYRQYAPAGSPLYRFEEEARAARRGLWTEPDPLPPWEWRAARRALPATPPR
jgi:endonuclease YncB( thermonuclease family)